MKRLIFRFYLSACIALFCIACTNSEKLSGNEFLIEGIISGVEDGAIIRLSRIEGSSVSILATDTLNHGKFLFKSEAVSNPDLLMILPQGDGFPSMLLNVWAAPGAKIKIRGKGTLHPIWEVQSSIPNQKEENRYNKNSREILSEYARIAAERNAAMTRIMTAMSAGSSGDDVSNERMIVDSLDALTNSLNITLNLSYIDVMEKSKISTIWLDKMQSISSTVRFSKADADIDELRKKAEMLYGKMSEDDKTTPIGYEITAFLFPPTVVGIGDKLADGDFFDVNGKTTHLSDYSGKYLLLDFWSRSCGPCIMALPEMKEVAETCRDNLTIISISLDTDAVWKEALVAHDMPWVNIHDPKGMGGLAANYGVHGIPNYVVISPEGTIIDKWAGFGNGLIKRKVSENIK